MIRSLPVQVLIAVVFGVLIGLVGPQGQLKELSEVGKLIIHWVKLIAGPFLFLTIVASVVQVQVKWRDGLKLIGVAIMNTSIAIAIGVFLAKAFFTGFQIPSLNNYQKATESPTFTLSFASWLKTLTPTSLFAPFVQNDILLIALLSLVIAIAMRKVFAPFGSAKLKAISDGFFRIREVPGTILGWLIKIIPIAVFAVIAGSVSEYGIQPLIALLRFVAVVLFAFVLQVCFVYGSWIFGIKRIGFRRFIREAKQPVLYALGVNSSLATVPLTFEALKNLGVSARASSLGAGVATNLNNDGIVLYEAMGVFFISALFQVPMTESQMVSAALACIVASMGITGIPEAGFISLSVVVAALNLPSEALPLLLAVDWMIARWRSVVNVLSDMTLSIVIDSKDDIRSEVAV